MDVRKLMITVFALLLAACQSAGSGAAATVKAGLPDAGTHWQLVSGLPVKVPVDVEITLVFLPDHGIGGGSGCNRYSGRIDVSGEHFTVSPLAATKRACMGPGGEIEPVYLKALSQASSWSWQDGKLRLHGEDGSVLVFAADTDAKDAR